MTTGKVNHDFLLRNAVGYYTDPEEKHPPGWRGPAVVVAVKKDPLLVRHGAGYFRRHPHHIRPHVPGVGSENCNSTTNLDILGAAVAALEKEKDCRVLGSVSGRETRHHKK